MIEKIETKILEVLKADAEKEGSPLKTVTIERCPEDASSRLMSSIVGSVWIHFAGLKPSDPNGVLSATQDDELYFDLDIVMRNLRSGRDAMVADEVGAYDVMSRVRNDLTGFKPVLAAKPMCMTNCELTDAGQGFWSYTERFAVKVPYFAEKEEPVFPVAKKVTWQNVPNHRRFSIPKEETNE